MEAATAGVDLCLLGSCWIPGLCGIYNVTQYSGFAVGSAAKEGDKTGAGERRKEMGVGGRGDAHGMGQSRLPRGSSSSVWIVGIRQGLHRPAVAEGLVGRGTSTRKGTEEGTSLEERKDDISPLAGMVVGETGEPQLLLGQSPKSHLPLPSPQLQAPGFPLLPLLSPPSHSPWSIRLVSSLADPDSLSGAVPHGPL